MAVVVTTRLRPRNLILFAIAAVSALVVLALEGALRAIDLPFALFGLVVLLGAIGSSLRFLTMKRWVALFLTAGSFGLVTQAVGTGCGAWHYPNGAGTYLFVFYAFGFGALFIFAAASLLAQFGLPRSLHRPQLGSLLILALAAATLLGGSGHGARPGFVIYYVALGAFALVYARLAHVRTVLAIAIAGACFGLFAETLGARAGLWRFSGPHPPAWLIIVSWPLESLLHIGLSALFAREKLDLPQLRLAERRLFPPAPQHPMAVTAQSQKVAIRRGEDKRALLDEVLEATGFWPLLEKKLAASGKPRESFRVVLKPNFMFMYSKADHSTYTDPELVEHLCDRLAARGFTDLTVVEAQSCYGNEFTAREVEHVAHYVGYRARNYRVVDLTKERVAHRFPPPLGAHVVGPTWRDADFRISFAKNKTHTWAVYTLTIKNIYGALAAQNKLLEYHTRREIYSPTICMLLDFPVHFGLIDAFWSSDGPFGIFANTEPKPTRAIVGGESLLAVDWVGAQLMQLDPLKSRYMQLAVQAFGTPTPVVDGDATPWSPWTNVPDALLTGVDAAEELYGFTSLFFHLLNRMDGVFPRKSHSLPWRLARAVLEPIRARIFVPPLGPDGKHDHRLD